MRRAGAAEEGRQARAKVPGQRAQGSLPGLEGGSRDLLVRMGGERLEAGRASQVLTLILCRHVLDLPCEVVTLGLLGELMGVFI